MRAIVFGASGMVGQGVLRECLRSGQVDAVLVIGRSSCGESHAKITEIIHPDLFEYETLRAQLSGYDACFFCLGVSAGGMTEADYTRVTHDLTLAAAAALLAENPRMTFIYVSGQSTDSTEQGRTMWARVKGKTENALLRLGFARAFMFRPGYIQPLGIKSKTRAYRVLYAVLGPLYPLWKLLFPRYVTTTQKVGLAMLRVAEVGFDKTIVDTSDINALAEASSSQAEAA